VIGRFVVISGIVDQLSFHNLFLKKKQEFK